MQPSFEIKFHPVDLSEYGKTPTGLPLYRVVWAESRKTRLLYNGKLRIIPRYLALFQELADVYPDLTPEQKTACTRNMRAHWILERWKSPEEFIGMSRERYNAMAVQFPLAPTEEFPSDGEYDFEHWFPFEVDEALLKASLHQYEERRHTVTLAEKRAEAVAADEMQEKRQEQNFLDTYEEAREESFSL